jgi:predicted Zn-dependent peptidase
MSKPAMFASTDQLKLVTLEIDWLGGPPDDKYADRTVLANMLNVSSPLVSTRYVQHRQGGVYALEGTFEPDKAAAAIKAISVQLRALGDGSALDRENFRGALRRAETATLEGAWSSVGWAEQLAIVASLGRDLHWLAAQNPRYAALRYDDLARLAKTEVSLDRASWSISGPRDAVTQVYAALGVTPVWLN